MFDIGWSEILVIVVITILVVGPKELPGLLRTIGKTVGNLRRMAGDFQSQFNDALKEAELDEVKQTIGDIRKLDPSTAVKDAVKKQLTEVADLDDDLRKQMSLSDKDIDAALASDQSMSAEALAAQDPAAGNVMLPLASDKDGASDADAAVAKDAETKKAD